MKSVLLGAIAYVFYYLWYASIAWSGIEFILYLVKGREFNWVSIISIGVCMVIMLLCLIGSALLGIREERCKQREELKKTSSVPKSKFQQRVDSMLETASRHSDTDRYTRR